MSKGNKQRGNREAKKPKKEKPKIVVTSGFQNASASPPASAKKPK